MADTTEPANDNGWRGVASARYGEAIAAELPALLGRAGAIAPNRVQNGSQRGEDDGAGSRRRQLAVVGLRKLAALWASGARREAVAWWLWFVRTSPEGRSDAAARRVHLVSLEREERIELLSHTSGPEAAGAKSAGRRCVELVRGLFDLAPEVDSGGSWLSELVEAADVASAELDRDERAAMGARRARRAARRARRAARRQSSAPTDSRPSERSTCPHGPSVTVRCPSWRRRRCARVLRSCAASEPGAVCPEHTRWRVHGGAITRSIPPEESDRLRKESA